MAATVHPRVLVVFHSGEGQTEKIADRIVRELERSEARAALSEAASAPPPTAYDAVVIGDSIHGGRHSRQLARWVERYEAELADVPVALFQVSLTSAIDDETHSAEANRLVQQFLNTPRDSIPRDGSSPGCWGSWPTRPSASAPGPDADPTPSASRRPRTPPTPRAS